MPHPGPDYSKRSFETIKDDVDAIAKELETKLEMNATEQDALDSLMSGTIDLGSVLQVLDEIKEVNDEKEENLKSAIAEKSLTDSVHLGALRLRRRTNRPKLVGLFRSHVSIVVLPDHL